MNGEDVKSGLAGIMNTAGGLIGWLIQFVTKYANTLLLIGLVLAISKVTSGNKLQVKV